jgi:CRISPR-associated protein Csx17
VNASSSFAGGNLTNPWSFILALEGTLVFSAAATRRLDSAGGSQQAFPFTVSATRAGYTSCSENEKLRGEVWMPLWTRPASFIEISALFSEGRATLSGRTAHSGLDFARSVASLGVDRGLDSFTRYMFAERNGKANYAVPLGRFRTLWAPQTDLLDEVAPWVSSLYKVRETSHALAAAAGSIENAMLQFCQSPGRERLRRLFLLLGDASTVMARSPLIPSRVSIPPLDRLSTRWISETSDGSPECRLAASLASIYREQDRVPVRMLLEPLSFDRRRRLEYGQDPPKVNVCSSAVDLMTGLLDRMSLDDHPWNRSHFRAGPGDVAAFLDGRTDDAYLLRLLRAMLMIRWGSGQFEKEALGEADTTEPGADYWILKLCWTSGNDVPGWTGVDPAVIRAAIAGRHQRAVALASTRMRALGRMPMDFTARIAPGRARRIAAALLVPVWSSALSRAAERLAPASSDRFLEEGEPNVG